MASERPFLYRRSSLSEVNPSFNGSAQPRQGNQNINGSRDFSRTGDIDEIEPPPSELASVSNELLKTFWYISRQVRDTLKSVTWRNNMKQGKFPYICMNNDWCRVFLSRHELEDHWAKKPGHKVNVNELIGRAQMIENQQYRRQQAMQRRSRSPLMSSDRGQRSSSFFDSGGDQYRRPYKRQREPSSPYRARSPESPSCRSRSRARSPDSPRGGRERSYKRQASKISDEETDLECRHCETLLPNNKEYNKHMKYFGLHQRCPSPVQESECFRCHETFSPENLKHHLQNTKVECSYWRKSRPPSPKGPHPDDLLQQSSVPNASNDIVLQEPQVTSSRLRASPIQQTSPISPPMPPMSVASQFLPNHPSQWQAQAAATMNFSLPPPPIPRMFHQNSTYTLPMPVPTNLASATSQIFLPMHQQTAMHPMQEQMTVSAHSQSARIIPSQLKFPSMYPGPPVTQIPSAPAPVPAPRAFASREAIVDRAAPGQQPIQNLHCSADISKLKETAKRLQERPAMRPTVNKAPVTLPLTQANSYNSLLDRLSMSLPRPDLGPIMKTSASISEKVHRDPRQRPLGPTLSTTPSISNNIYKMPSSAPIEGDGKSRLKDPRLERVGTFPTTILPTPEIDSQRASAEASTRATFEAPVLASQQLEPITISERALLKPGQVPSIQRSSSLNKLPSSAAVGPPVAHTRDPRLERRPSLELSSSVSTKPASLARERTIIVEASANCSVPFEKRTSAEAVIPSGILSKPSESLPTVQNLFGRPATKTKPVMKPVSILSTSAAANKGVKRPVIDDTPATSSRSNITSSWKRSRRDVPVANEKTSEVAEITTNSLANTVPNRVSDRDDQKKLLDSAPKNASKISILPEKKVEETDSAKKAKVEAASKLCDVVLKGKVESVAAKDTSRSPPTSGGSFEAALVNADSQVKRKEIVRKGKQPPKVKTKPTKSVSKVIEKKARTKSGSLGKGSESKKVPKIVAQGADVKKIISKPKQHSIKSPAKAIKRTSDKHISPKSPKEKVLQREDSASSSFEGDIFANQKKYEGRKRAKSKETWEVGGRSSQRSSSIDSNSSSRNEAKTSGEVVHDKNDSQQNVKVIEPEGCEIVEIEMEEPKPEKLEIVKILIENPGVKIIVAAEPSFNKDTTKEDKLQVESKRGSLKDTSIVVKSISEIEFTSPQVSPSSVPVDSQIKELDPDKLLPKEVSSTNRDDNDFLLGSEPVKISSIAEVKNVSGKECNALLEVEETVTKAKESLEAPVSEKVVPVAGCNDSSIETSPSEAVETVTQELERVATVFDKTAIAHVEEEVSDTVKELLNRTSASEDSYLEGSMNTEEIEQETDEFTVFDTQLGAEAYVTNTDNSLDLSSGGIIPQLQETTDGDIIMNGGSLVEMDKEEGTETMLFLGEALDENEDGYHSDVADRPLVLVHGECESIDFCPGCGAKLDPVKGNYSLNCVTFEVNITCVSCKKYVLIKDAFNDRDKAALLSQ